MKTAYTTEKRVELKRNQFETRILAKKSRKKIFFDSVIAILVAITPFIYYIYEVVPSGTETWELWGIFKFSNGNYSSVYAAFWFFFSKLVPLYLFTIWFITCKHWWYHIILIPIAMYAFQLFTVLNKSSRFIDEVEIYWILPILMVVAPMVYWFRIRLFDKLVHGIDLKAIEQELDEYKEKERQEKKRKEEERKRRLSDIH